MPSHSPRVPPSLQPGGCGGRHLQGREGSGVRGSSQTYLHVHGCGVYTKRGSEAAPASISPSASGMPVVRSTTSAEPVPWWHRGGGGGHRGSHLAITQRGGRPAREWRPGPVFPGQSSLVVTVKPRLIPVIFS